MKVGRLGWSIAVVWLVAACSRSPDAGKERGACYGNNTCDPGLSCMSQVCVRPPPADCGPVAQKLATYRVGNYAEPEVRDQTVAALTQQCQEAQLSVDEGKCILDAKNRLELSKCPRPLLEELKPDKIGCKQASASVVKQLLASLAGGDPTMAQKAASMRDEVTGAIEQACTDDAWPPDLVHCLSIADSNSDMDACMKLAPPEFQQAEGKRLEPIIEKMMKP